MIPAEADKRALRVTETDGHPQLPHVNLDDLTNRDIARLLHDYLVKLWGKSFALYCINHRI